MKKKNKVTSKSRNLATQLVPQNKRLGRSLPNQSVSQTRFVAMYARVNAPDPANSREPSPMPWDYEMLSTIIEKLGAGPVRFYMDVGCPGSNLQRPELKRLRKDVMAGVIGCVIARDLSRLTRVAADARMLVEEFEALGTSFVSMADYAANEITRWSNAHLTFSLCEHEHLKRKSLVGQIVRAQNGLWHGGTPPVGYTCQNGALKKNPTSVKIVQRIFGLFLHLGGVADVVKDLKAKGIHVIPAALGQAGGHGITADLVRRVLRNPAYAGYVPGPKSWSIPHNVTPFLIIDGRPYFKGRHAAMITDAVTDRKLDSKGGRIREGFKGRVPGGNRIGPL